MQWLITFMGNLPWETGWYLRRVDVPGTVVLVLSVLLFTTVPFLALLPAANRSAPQRLRLLSGAIFAGYLAENLWRLGGAFERDAAYLVALVVAHAAVFGGMALLMRMRAGRWLGAAHHV